MSVTVTPPPFAVSSARDDLFPAGKTTRSVIRSRVGVVAEQASERRLAGGAV